MLVVLLLFLSSKDLHGGCSCANVFRESVQRRELDEERCASPPAFRSGDGMPLCVEDILT